MSILKDLGFINRDGIISSPDSDTLCGKTVYDIIDTLPLSLDVNNSGYILNDDFSPFTLSKSINQDIWKKYEVTLYNYTHPTVTLNESLIGGVSNDFENLTDYIVTAGNSDFNIDLTFSDYTLLNGVNISSSNLSNMLPKTWEIYDNDTNELLSSGISSIQSGNMVINPGYIGAINFRIVIKNDWYGSYNDGDYVIGSINVDYDGYIGIKVNGDIIKPTRVEENSISYIKILNNRVFEFDKFGVCDVDYKLFVEYIPPSVLTEDVDGQIVIDGINFEDSPHTVTLTQEDGQSKWRQYQVYATNLSEDGTITVNDDTTTLIQELESTLNGGQSITKVVCGNLNTFAILNDGTLKVVGNNGYGQLGIGNTTNQTTWVSSLITDVKEIICGMYHTFAILNNGIVKAVGNNGYAQLGIGNTTNQTTWVTSNITGVKKIACGNSHTLALTTNGTVMAVGRNDSGQLGIGNTTNQSSWVTSATNMIDIACGDSYSMGISSTNSLRATGYNNYGQLGNGNTTTQTSWVTTLSNVKQVDCGYSHTMALLNDGTVKAVGVNGHGQFGIGNTTYQYSWVTSNITDVKEIVCSFYHTMAVLNDGTIMGAGFNTYGQLGNGATSTTQTTWVTSNITGVKQVDCGRFHTMAVLNDGTLKAVGGNDSAQLGTGNTTKQTSWVNSFIYDVISIFTSQIVYTDTLKISVDGSVKSVDINLWVQE